MWGVTAWFRRELCSLPWFYSILCRTTHKEQGWPLELTLSKHLIKVTKLIFSGLCGSLGLKHHLLLPLDDDMCELKLSSSGFNTSPVLSQNWCFDSYQPFPLEALLPLFLLKCKSLDGDLQDVQRTHVVKISLLFLPKRGFSLWHGNSFLWWSQTRVLLISCLLVWILVVKSYKYDKRNWPMFNILIKRGGSKEFWNAEFIFDGYAETVQGKTVLVLRQACQII